MNNNDEDQVVQDLQSRRIMDLEELDKLAERFFMPACIGDTKSASIYLKVLERRSRLLGLDEATKVTMEVSTYDIVELNRQFELLQGNSNGEGSSSLA
jgi:hypothetical protein